MAALPQIVRCNAHLGKQILHRNTLATAVSKPGLTFIKTAAILLGYGFVVGRGHGDRTGHGIDHHFEQMTNGRELAWIKLVEQLMSILFIHSLYFPISPLQARPAV
jgi:hypothetical protein